MTKATFHCGRADCKHCPVPLLIGTEAELAAEKEFEVYVGKRQDFWNKPGWFGKKGKKPCPPPPR